MKEMKRVLVVLVAVLMVSSVLYAGPVRVNDTEPTTDGATWGGKAGPPIRTEGATWGGKAGPPIQTDGATWGANSLEPIPQRQLSPEETYRQRIIDMINSLGRSLVVLVEGATWG